MKKHRKSTDFLQTERAYNCGDSLQLYQSRVRDGKTVFFVEPVIFKGSFCNAFRWFHPQVPLVMSEDAS